MRRVVALLVLVQTYGALDPPAHHLHHAPPRNPDPTRPSQNRNWRCGPRGTCGA